MSLTQVNLKAIFVLPMISALIGAQSVLAEEAKQSSSVLEQLAQKDDYRERLAQAGVLGSVAGGATAFLGFSKQDWHYYQDPNPAKRAKWIKVMKGGFAAIPVGIGTALLASEIPDSDKWTTARAVELTAGAATGILATDLLVYHNINDSSRKMARRMTGFVGAVGVTAAAKIISDRQEKEPSGLVSEDQLEGNPSGTVAHGSAQ